mgnify:CR=1 FL=1
MANIKSQIKRIKTNLKAQERNKAVKSELKTVIRAAKKAIDSGDKTAAVNAVAAATRKLKDAKPPKDVADDVAAQLRTPEEMAAYLDAWLIEAPDDAAGIARALGDIARAKGMTQVAKDSGLSRESLYRALSADGNPSFATVLKVARALGLKLHAEAG